MDPDVGRRMADAYDLFSADVRQDPSGYHRALREHCPVHQANQPESSFYTLSRYQDVTPMLENYQLWSSQFGQMVAYAEEGGIRSDPPTHTIYRRLVSPLFGTQRVACLEGRFEKAAHQLINSFIGAGHTDLSKNFAQIYPITVAADLLGVEADRHHDFSRWSTEFIRGANQGIAEVEQQARDDIYGYLGPLLEHRRMLLQSDPNALPDDALSVFVHASHPERRPFSNEEMLPVLLLLLVGGTDTTTLLLGNCLYRLLQNPTLWEQICSNPDLVPVAIEESLRFDTPVMGIFRTNNKPVKLHGRDIPSDAKCMALLASANRDAEAWSDPDEFRLDRDVTALRQSHLAFGRGIHTCIGAPLARLDAAVALRAIAERMPRLRLNGTVEFFQPSLMQGVVRLPVRWD